MSILENINLKLSVDKRQVDKQFNDAARTVTQGLDAMTLGAEAFEAKWADITDNIRNVKRVASGIAISAAIYGVTSAIVDASLAVLSFSDNLENARISMEYFARDSLQAWQYIRELEDFAAYTPFNTESAINMAKYLQAMSVPIGSSKAVLEVISDTSAATGATEENMQRIVTALGQILTKGKLAAEEVRQLANANIPIYDILKEELDMSGAQIKNIGRHSVDAGKAVVAILDGLEKRYKGASAKIAETMSGMLETIKDDALIISSSFFAGTVDDIEGSMRAVRDTLDEWREIALSSGTGGLIEHILGDIDPSGELEQFVMAGIAGIENLKTTIANFATEDGDLLKAFGSTAYASIMSVVIAADYLLRGVNVIKDGADKLLGVINDLSGMSLTLTDVAAGLLIFRTVGNTFQFAANTAMWAGKSVLNLGVSLTSYVKPLATANALTRTFAASLMSISAAAAIAWGSLKLMNSITGLSDDSKLVTDAYKEKMEAENAALNAYSESLNQSYEALADGAFEAFTDIEDESKKSAKRVQKTWLMSFDEVFQIREDPNKNDDLTDFSDLDWSQYFSLPLFRFPERVGAELEETLWHAEDSINAARNSLDGIAALLPALIGGMTVFGTALNNRQVKIATLQAEGLLREEDYTLKEQLTKFTTALKDYSGTDDALFKLTEQYRMLDSLDATRKEIQELQRIVEDKIDLARAAYKTSPTDSNKAVLDALIAQKEKLSKFEGFVDAQSKARNILAENIEVRQKQTITELKKLREQRARVGSNEVISTKGIDAADSVLSARNINKQLETLEQLAADAASTEANISKQMRKLTALNSSDQLKQWSNEILALLKKGRTSGDKVTANKLVAQIDAIRAKAAKWLQEAAEPINYELQSLQRSLADKLSGVDKSIRTIQSDIDKHRRAFTSTDGVDINVLDSIISKRVDTVADTQQRLISLITMPHGDVSNIELETIARGINSVTESIEKLSTSTSPTILAALRDVRSTNDKLQDWLKAQNKYSSILQDLDAVEESLLHPDKSVNTSYLRNLRDELTAKSITANRNLAITQNNVRNIDDVYKEVIKARNILADAKSGIEGLTSAYTRDAVLINKVASLATETKALLSSSSVAVSSRQYSVISDLLYTLSDQVAALDSTDVYKPLLKNLLDASQASLEKTLSPSSMDAALKAFNSSMEKILNDGITKYSSISRDALAQVINRAPLTAVTELDILPAQVDIALDTMSKRDVYADSYKSTMAQARLIDDVASDIRKFGSSFDEATQRLTNALATTLENVTGDNLVPAIQNVLDSKEYSKQINNPAVASFIKDRLGSINEVDVDTINKTIQRVIDEEKAIKKRVENASKVRNAANTAIVSIPDEIDEKLKTIYTVYEQAVEKSSLLDMAQVSKIVEAEADIVNWYGLGRKEYEERHTNPFADDTKAMPLEVRNRINDAAGVTYTLDSLPSFDTIKDLYGKLDEALKLEGDLIEELTNTRIDAVKEVKRIAAEYDEYRAASTESLPPLRNVDNTINVITSKIDAVELNLLQQLDERLPSTYKQQTVWSRYMQHYPLQDISGGFKNATSLYRAAEINEGVIKSAYDYLADVVHDQDLKYIGTGAYRQGMNAQGITRQGNNFYDTIKSIVSGGADELAFTDKSAINKGYAAALNTRTREIFKNIFGNVYRGNTGYERSGRVAAKIDGLFTIADDTYTLVNRTLVSKQTELIDLVDTIADTADKFITTDTGQKIATIPFSRFIEEFGGIAEDVVNKVGAGLTLSKAAGAYVSFTDVSSIIERRPDMDITPSKIPLDSKGSTEAIEKYTRGKLAELILADGASGITDALYAENMHGFMITPDKALDKFRRKLFENASALESSIYAYKVAKVAIPETADDLIKKSNALGKTFGNVSVRFDDMKSAIAALPRVTRGIDSAGFNEYLKQLLSSATNSKTNAEVNATLKNMLSAIDDSITTDKPFIDNGFATANKKNFTFTIEGSDALKDARDAVSSALSFTSSRTAGITAEFNDIVNALDRGTVPTDKVIEKIQILINRAKFLEADFGVANARISTQLSDMLASGTWTGLKNNPFRLLSSTEATGKIFSDLIAATGDSLDVLLEDASTTVQRFVPKAIEAYEKSRAKIERSFPTVEVEQPNTLKIPVATADTLKVNEVKAGMLTAKDRADKRLLGQQTFEQVTANTRDSLKDVVDPFRFLDGPETSRQVASILPDVPAAADTTVKVTTNIPDTSRRITDAIAAATDEVTRNINKVTGPATTVINVAATEVPDEINKQISDALNLTFKNYVAGTEYSFDELEDLVKVLNTDLPAPLVTFQDVLDAWWEGDLTRSSKLVDSLKDIPNKLSSVISDTVENITNIPSKVAEVLDNVKTIIESRLPELNPVEYIKHESTDIYDLLKGNLDSASSPGMTKTEEALQRLALLTGDVSNSTETLKSWADLVLTDAADTSLSDELKAYRELMQEKIFEEFALDEDAIARGDFDIKEIEKALKKEAEAIWDKDTYNRLVAEAGLIDEVSSGSKIAEGFVNALDSKLGRVFLQEFVYGLSGFDVVDSARQTFEARSTGIDEYASLTDKWSSEFNAIIQPFTQSANNLVSWGEALEVGTRNLAIEGAATGVGINVVGGGVASTLGLTGGAAAATSLAAALPIVLAGLLFQHATGAYDIANMASETFAKTLEDHSWAYDQVYQQTGDSDKAREAQLKAQRDIYTKYFEKMNFWSGKEIGQISNFNEDKNIRSSSDLINGADADALEHAIASMTGAADVLGKYYIEEKDKYQKGYLKNADTGEVLALSALDAAKVEEFLYAAITGGIKNIAEEREDMSFSQKLFDGRSSNMLNTYNALMKNIDDVTKARIEDFFKLEIKAADFVANSNESYIRELLEAYGVFFSDMSHNVDAVIAIYKAEVDRINSTIRAKAEFINSGDIADITADTLISGTGVANRLLNFDTSSIEQTYLDALADATGIYLQSMSDTMTALTVNIDQAREQMTGFTMSMPETITVGVDTVSLKTIAADTAAVDILAGMGVQINTDGTVTIANVAENINKSGYDREMSLGIGSISKYEKDALDALGVGLSDLNIDGTTEIALNENTMAKAVAGLSYTLHGVEPTSITPATVEALKAAGVSITQNEETGDLSATINNAAFASGNKALSDILKSVDSSRISEDLRDAFNSIDALVQYYKGRGDSVISSADGVILETSFELGGYSKALDAALQEAGAKMIEASNREGEEAVYLSINKVSDVWEEALTTWKTSEITPSVRSLLEELGAEVTTVGEYTVVNTANVLDALANDSSKYLTEVLFDNAELWDAFPDEMKQVMIDAGLATADGFIVIKGEALNGWYQIQDMFAKQWSALDTETATAILALQGTTLIGWDELTALQKASLAELGITSKEQYAQNADELLSKHAEKFGLLRQDTVLSWSQLTEDTKNNLAALKITSETEYVAYLTNLGVHTGQKLSAVDATTAQSLATIGATTMSGWAGVKHITDVELSATEALALGYMKFEDLPATIQQALAEGKEGSAYETLHSGWYALSTDAETQLGNLDAVVAEGFDNAINTATAKVTKLRELISSPEMQAETYLANLSSLASSNLHAARKGADKYANGGSGWRYENGGYVGGKWKSWDDSITIGKQFVAFDAEGGAYYFYNMYLDGKYYGQIAQSAQTGARKKWLNEGGTPVYTETSDIPAFKLGGLIYGDGLFRAGEFGMNEAVLPLEQPQAMSKVGHALAAAIPAYQLVAPLASALGLRDGGVASFDSYHTKDNTSHIVEQVVDRVISAQAHRAPQPGYMSDGENKRPLVVGTLIADKAGLRELNRKMQLIERQDGGR